MDVIAAEAGRPCATWVELLRDRATALGQDVGFIFLADGDEQELAISYAQLDRQARAIASTLQDAGAAGGRALLLYPPGLEFIAGLFGCWYAGVTAVPVYPPRSAQHPAAFATLRAIAEDAHPTVVLTVSRLLPTLKASAAQLPLLGAVPLIATDDADLISRFDRWNEPAVNAQTVACLQYTSGSTSMPKGVMLTHANLMFGSEVIRDCFGHSRASRGVIWLPPYHDMGLIGGILQPLYAGFPVTLMAPAAFLQRPLRWLSAITRDRATTSGGPNFAYELCARSVREQDKRALDLSSWEVAFNGAEPIDPHTMERFARAFASCGFRREAFYPCYGLAEATLLVSGGERAAPPLVRRFDAIALNQHRVQPVPPGGDGGKELASCGRPRPTGAVLIVHPESCLTCDVGAIGEIWVRGGAVARGYWQKPTENDEVFGARLADTGEGPFLRTGDLGYFDQGELFITGRLKDLIIIRGRNHYPQDIEQVAQASHAALQPGAGAAFSVNGEGPERLVIVQELERTQRNVEPQIVIDAIREHVARHHELQVAGIVLLKPGQILKTSSGKVRRRACRAAYLSKEFESLAWWVQPVEAAEAAADEPETSSTPAAPLSYEQLEDLIIEKFAALLSLPADQIDPAEPFARYGLDSAGATGLAGELELALGWPLAATAFYDHPSVSDLARHLTDEPPALAPTAG